MAVNRTHIIQKQTFELSASGAGINLDWEQRASDCVRNIMNPCIEACFNEVSPANAHLVIDKLDIDLGSFTTEEFEKKVSQRLREVLQAQLQACLEVSKTNKVGNTTGDDDIENMLFYGTAGTKTSDVENPARLLTDSQAVQIALLHFLKEGRMPWWYSIESNTVLIDELYETTWMNVMEEEEKTTIRKILLHSAAARVRLVNHFTAEWIAALLQTIALRGNEGMVQWTIIKMLAEQFTNLRPLLHQHFWLQWIKATQENKEYASISSVITKTAAGNTTLLKKMHLALLQIIEVESPSMMIAAEYIAYLEKELEELQDIAGKSSTAAVTSDEKATVQRSVHTVAADKQTIDKLLDDISSEKKTKSREVAEEEGLIIAAAGLVILHPFLAELFSSNNLLNKKEWASEAAQARAVRYLAFLSYGNEAAPEYDLVFHKTLVGMDVEMALAADEPLTPEETASCNELLQAVITHWKALRNTSADGLREAFLQREGKITLADKGYIVQVAQKPQDILLSHLPWGCGMIKLPWLDKIIHVNWI